jgi:hypothetical protein
MALSIERLANIGGNDKDVKSDTKEKVLFEETLRKNDFVFKKFMGYKLCKLKKSDMFYIRMYNTRFKVYPIGDWEPYDSNTVYYVDAIKRIKAGESLLTIIFNNL